MTKLAVQLLLGSLYNLNTTLPLMVPALESTVIVAVSYTDQICAVPMCAWKATTVKHSPVDESVFAGYLLSPEYSPRKHQVPIASGVAAAERAKLVGGTVAGLTAATLTALPTGVPPTSHVFALSVV